MKALASFLFAWLGLTAACWATQIVGRPEITWQGSEATVRWQTDVACGTRAKVEPFARVTGPADRTPTTNHEVTIHGLKPGTAYQISFGTARKWLASQSLTATSGSPSDTPGLPQKRAPVSARNSWGNPSSLVDHFNRHGGDFGATSPEDYARQAAEFLQRAKRDGFPAKLDRDGVLRVFDPASGAFAAYNRNGTTKTYFKPGSRDYFARQPGREIDLRTWK